MLKAVLKITFIATSCLFFSNAFASLAPIKMTSEQINQALIAGGADPLNWDNISHYDMKLCYLNAKVKAHQSSFTYNNNGLSVNLGSTEYSSDFALALKVSYPDCVTQVSSPNTKGCHYRITAGVAKVSHYASASVASKSSGSFASSQAKFEVTDIRPAVAIDDVGCASEIPLVNN